MNIIIDENSHVSRKIQGFLLTAAERCVTDEGIDPSLVEISLTIVSEGDIRELNRLYRDTDRVTDVLSFPQYDDLTEIDNDEVIALGDVVICDAVAHKQAREYGHSYEREFVYLFVHSVLHLLGYDHMTEEDKRGMRAEEEKVMEYIGLTRGFTLAYDGSESAVDDDSGDAGVNDEYEEGGKSWYSEQDGDVYSELMRRAEAVSQKAYAPYSGFHVGAALLCSDGSIYTGVNVENASYGAALCAERSAVASAVSDGNRKFNAIAVFSPDGNAIPCGICRQVLLEFGSDIDVVLKDDDGSLRVTEISRLLPEGFAL